MDQALLTAAAGMKAHTELLEVLGNNIANAGTTGYKGDNEFFRLFTTAWAEPGRDARDIPSMPFIQGAKIDFRQGALASTEAPLDLALSGPGFFVVEAGAGKLYTRNGHLARSATGRLETTEGYALLDVQDQAITLPEDGEVHIAASGMVSVGGLEIAQLAVVEFPGTPPLAKAGSSYFRAAQGVDPQPAAATSISQGRLESSNVNAALSSVRLMLAGRNFEMLRRVASLVGDEMNGRAVSELGSFGR
jgi:flagellar basal body rod protein FlgG